jgi:hypothetical protein
MNAFWEIIVKTTVIHTVTYFVVGIGAFYLFNYKATLRNPANNMKPATDSLVKAGVLFQPFRGILFGIVFYLLREVLFFRPNGWLVMWIMLAVVGIFSTFAPAGSSIEGFVYLKSGGGGNRGGLVEILTQSFLLSTMTYYWIAHPELTWLSWLLGASFIAAMALPMFGLLKR